LQAFIFQHVQFSVARVEINEESVSLDILFEIHPRGDASVGRTEIEKNVQGMKLSV